MFLGFSINIAECLTTKLQINQKHVYNNHNQDENCHQALLFHNIAFFLQLICGWQMQYTLVGLY